MLAQLRDIVIASVRRRAEQGDCPTEPAHSVETLENVILDLTTPTPTIPAGMVADDVRGISEDYQTSEQHHPGHVLIPLAKFEQLQAAEAALEGASDDAESELQDQVVVLLTAEFGCTVGHSLHVYDKLRSFFSKAYEFGGCGVPLLTPEQIAKVQVFAATVQPPDANPYINRWRKKGWLAAAPKQAEQQGVEQ